MWQECIKTSHEWLFHSIPAGHLHTRFLHFSYSAQQLKQKKFFLRSRIKRLPENPYVTFTVPYTRLRKFNNVANNYVPFTNQLFHDSTR